MKLSLVFELLLIFVLLAFAASKHIGRQKNNKKGIQKQNDYIKIEDNSINRYCKCSEAYCNCCRELAVPLVNLNGPGCASLMYLNGDKMSVSLSFGKKVITNRTLSGRKPSPVCMPLPGGISKFCGRVYNIARAGEEFRACLGLELQAKSAVEAAVRVSCFKFGPRGVTSEPADPLPLVPQDEKVTEDDEDDDDDEEDDDTFALDTGDDDDDDDDEEEDDDDGDLDAVNDVDSADYTGFSVLGEDLLGGLFGSSGGKKSNKNKNKQAPLSSTTTTTTTRRPRPFRRTTKKPATKKPTTRKPTTKKPTIKVSTQRPLITRTTTVKVRPGNRRPTRRPVRRTTTKPTVASSAVTEETAIVSTISTTVAPIRTANTDVNISNKNQDSLNAETHQSHQVIPITEMTTPKPATTFEDAGLEMSLAHITGQLSLMPVTQLIPTSIKESNIKVTNPKETNYEKIAIITSKPHSLIPFATTVDDDNEEMVQIVQSLDSHSAEHAADSEKVADETRSHKNIAELHHYEGLSLPKQKNRGQFNLDDLDVLDLTGIGESVGHQLGIFGRHKRQNKNKDVKPHGGKGFNDYDYLLGLDSLSDSIALPDIDDLSRKDRRRQNKMMRGIWSQT